MQAILWSVLLILVSYLSSFIYFRLDLTGDKRFTLFRGTREMLDSLSETIFVTVYLDGDMPLGFKRMRRDIRELLDEFRVASHRSIDYEFVNPSAYEDPELRNEVQADLVRQGLVPTDVYERRRDGGTNQRRLFPGAVLRYRNRSTALNLLMNNPGFSAEQNLSHSIEVLEYGFANAIRLLTTDKVGQVAFIEGHGELDAYQTADITAELARYYEVYRGFIDVDRPNLDPYAAVIIAGPRSRFSEKEKFVLDQYLMNGGKILWLLDMVEVYHDSLSAGETTLALLRDLNIDDQLFRYGVRIQPALARDIQCALIPVNTALAGEQPRFTPAPWYYFPLLAPRSDHPVTRNLNMVKAQYAGVIDTLASPMVKKTTLLGTSQYTKVVNAPVVISVRQVDEAPVQAEYNRSFLPVAVLLEGTFTSVFRNRMTGNYALPEGKVFREQSVPTAMIVVSDADIIRNDLRWKATVPEPLPLGYDRYMQQTFGNKDFIMNAVNYLTDDTGLMQLRTREFKLRLLNKAQVTRQHTLWQVINTLLPILIISLAGIITMVVKKMKYTKV